LGWDVADRTVLKAIENQRRARAKLRDAGGSVPWPRVGNLALGIWLQVSAFAWPHTDASRVSAWLPGLIIAIVALLSMGAPPMRWLNAFMALWLVIWTFTATSTEPLAYMNGVLCGIAVFALSLVPSQSAASDFRD
jgi:hypothetical protein